MVDEPKPSIPPATDPRTEPIVTLNRGNKEETRFVWAERIGVGPVMAIICLGMIFYSLFNSVNLLSQMVRTTTTALSEVAGAVRDIKSVMESTQKSIEERQRVSDLRQKENDVRFAAIQKSVLENQAIMKDDVTASQLIVADLKASHEERKGFWEPAAKDLATMKEQLKGMAISDANREKLQAEILVESKRRADAEEGHAKEVREALKGKQPTPAPAKQQP
jgi:hypothetical protein